MNAPFRLPRRWAAALVAACVTTGAGGQPPTEPTPGYPVAEAGALLSPLKRPYFSPEMLILYAFFYIIPDLNNKIKPIIKFSFAPL